MAAGGRESRPAHRPDVLWHGMAGVGFMMCGSRWSAIGTARGGTSSWWNALGCTL